MGSYGTGSIYNHVNQFSSIKRCLLDLGYKCVSHCEMKDGTDYYWCDAEHPTNHFKGDCKFHAASFL